MPSDRAPGMALCRAILHAFSVMSGNSGPDALRARLGAEDALAICRGAGMDVAAIEARWSAAAPARPARQRREADIFAADPAHDPRVVNAQVRGGDVRAALREVATDVSNPVRAEKASIAIDYLASGRVSVAEALDQASVDTARKAYERQGGMPVPLGVSAGPDSRPQQRSAVHQDVAPLASENGGLDL